MYFGFEIFDRFQTYNLWLLRRRWWRHASRSDSVTTSNRDVSSRRNHRIQFRSRSAWYHIYSSYPISILLTLIFSWKGLLPAIPRGPMGCPISISTYTNSEVSPIYLSWFPIKCNWSQMLRWSSQRGWWVAGSSIWSAGTVKSFPHPRILYSFIATSPSEGRCTRW